MAVKQGAAEYRDSMDPACRNNVKLLGALQHVEQEEAALIKAERDMKKQIRDSSRHNPNPHATEKEQYAFAEARNPGVFEKVEQQKRRLLNARRTLTDIKIDLRCSNRFSHDCSPDNCRGLEGGTH